MKNSIYIIIIPILFFLCCSPGYQKSVSTHRAECRFVSQDVGVDSSALRNIYDIYKDFMQSNNSSVDLLKIIIREGERQNTAIRVYAPLGDTTEMVFYNSNNDNKEKYIKDRYKVDKILSLQSIMPGRYTYYCLNELPNTVCFYFIKVKSKLSYKLMIEEGNEPNAMNQDSTLTPLFELLN